MKNILLIILFCFFNGLFAQEKVGLKEIYVENNLAYKVVDDELFSGQAQKVRKNGHLVYEEYYENGNPIKSVVYYNGTEKPIPARMTEFYQKSFDKKKETVYGLTKPTVEFKYYDQNGKKTLIEEYENDKLTYSCEYLKNKKHGTEFCFDDDGKELKIEYRNGKKFTQK
jgi:antitoxin component YwqK of YwqJK toxin-antitoxin module